MTDVMRFMLDVPSIEGTVIASQIKKVCATGIEGKKSYDLKEGAGVLNRHLDKYSEKNMADIKRIC